MNYDESFPTLNEYYRINFTSSEANESSCLRAAAELPLILAFFS